MPKLSAKGLRWLKGFHLIAVSFWIGGAIALILLYFLKNGVTDGSVLYGINQSIHHVDMVVVVIPGAFGCLITDLLYSTFSNWGFFKYNWLLFKWIVTVAAILFGNFFLGPWETTMMKISGKLGMVAAKLLKEILGRMFADTPFTCASSCKGKLFLHASTTFYKATGYWKPL